MESSCCDIESRSSDYHETAVHKGQTQVIIESACSLMSRSPSLLAEYTETDFLSLQNGADPATGEASLTYNVFLRVLFLLTNARNSLQPYCLYYVTNGIDRPIPRVHGKIFHFNFER